MLLIEQLKRTIPFSLKCKIKSIFYSYEQRIRIKKNILPHVFSIEETIKYIIQNKCSVSRFGDGEIRIVNKEDLEFQSYNPVLADRLVKVLKSESENHISCLPDIFYNLDAYESETKRYWRIHLLYYIQIWLDHIRKGGNYFNAYISRPYICYKDRSNAGIHFDLIKAIWEERDVVFVEGVKSRLGVGNDLFNNAKRIRRILAPAENAFTRYDRILDESLKQNKEVLFLLALGPTASVLAYDLSLAGYQAIDIGHLDVEYEWFLQKATTKVALKNKYVNETENGREPDEVDDKTYYNQIIISFE